MSGAELPPVAQRHGDAVAVGRIGGAPDYMLNGQDAARLMTSIASALGIVITARPPAARRVVYVAGPIRAPSAWQREQNIRRAEAAALEVWRMGAAPICVHAAGRFYDEEEARRDGWLEADLELVRRADAVLLVDGWDVSEGAQGEKREAERLGLPAFYSLAGLRRWIESKKEAKSP